MKIINLIIAISLIAYGAAMAPPSLDAALAGALLPAAARYYPLVGHWNGQGQLGETGKIPTSLALQLTCSKAASGWAIRCDMAAKNGKLLISEADLMGVDAVTGKGHWYAVTNQGETHDHITEWTSANEMKAYYSWVQEGKKMHENITVKLLSKKNLEFRSVVSADGKEVNVFSGTLKR